MQSFLEKIRTKLYYFIYEMTSTVDSIKNKLCHFKLLAYAIILSSYLYHLLSEF